MAPNAIRRYATEPTEIDGIESRTIGANWFPNVHTRIALIYIPAVSIFHGRADQEWGRSNPWPSS